MRHSTPRTFTGLARSGHKHKAENSGIFSDGTKGQKMDPQPKPSPRPVAGLEARQKASKETLRAALNVPAKKSMPGSGKMAAAPLQKYAIDHGEK